MTEKQSQAHRDRNRAGGCLHGAQGNGIPDFFRTSNGEGWITIIQDHQKLLAAVAPHKIVGPHRGKQAFRGFPQDLVSDEMAEGIVTFLK